MKKDKKIKMAIAGGIIIIAVITILAQPKKIKHTYEPATDITEIRACVKELTGSSKIDLDELLNNEQLLSDVTRFCLKTVEDRGAVLSELAK